MGNNAALSRTPKEPRRPLTVFVANCLLIWKETRWDVKKELRWKDGTFQDFFFFFYSDTHRQKKKKHKTSRRGHFQQTSLFARTARPAAFSLYVCLNLILILGLLLCSLKKKIFSYVPAAFCLPPFNEKQNTRLRLTSEINDFLCRLYVASWKRSDINM